MMGPGGLLGVQSGVNQLPTPPAMLKVSHIPSFVTAEDFTRLLKQLEGCVEARLLGRQPGGDQVGYAEFSDKLNASKAKALYNGWTGWGGRGLAVELTDFSLSQLSQPLPQGQKRMREGDDPLATNGSYKQARADLPAMGLAGGMANGQQQQQGPGIQPAFQDVPSMGFMAGLGSMANQGIPQQLLATSQQHAGVLQQHQPGQQALQTLQQQQPGLMQLQPTGQQQQLGGGLLSSGNLLAQQMQQEQQPSLMGSMVPSQQQPLPYTSQMQQQYNAQEPSLAGYVQQQPQSQLLQLQPQQGYGLASATQQPPLMLQARVPQVNSMMSQQQPQSMHSQMQQMQQQAQLMQQQPLQGMGLPAGHRGDIAAPVEMRQYPPDACNTLYIEGLPADVTRRELAHIFRAHKGYRSLRLVIKDSKKHAGEKLVMAFVEYSNTHYATEAMDALQGYPFDIDNPETMTFFVKYARPMDNPHRRPPGGPPMGGRGRGGGPEVLGGRGGMEGRGGRGAGRGAGRFGGGGQPPRESPRRDPHFHGR